MGQADIVAGMAPWMLVWEQEIEICLRDLKFSLEHQATVEKNAEKSTNGLRAIS